MDKYYTVPDLAAMFKLHEVTIRRKLETGEIGGHKLGKDWRISQEQLDAYLRCTSNVKTNE